MGGATATTAALKHKNDKELILIACHLFVAFLKLGKFVYSSVRARGWRKRRGEAQAKKMIPGTW